MSRAEAFAHIFEQYDMSELICNMSSNVQLAQLGANFMPISLSDRGQVKNNYLVSPTTAYIDYAQEEIFLTQKLRSRASSNILANLIELMRPLLLMSGLDHQVQLNNWMMSTCPWPKDMPEEFPTCLQNMVAQFPDRAIVLRSLNMVNNQALMSSLAALGFLHLPARKIYLHDYTRVKVPQNVRSDRNLLRKSEFSVTPASAFDEADFERTADLYAELYLNKYSALNPIYTPLFFKLAAESGIIKLTGLKDPSGKLQGIVGNFRDHNIDCTPIVGYNTALPIKTGLYRMLIWLSLSQSIEDGLCHNLSAGADRFKMLRGGVPTIEYSSVYVGHLPAPQRTANWMLCGLLNRFAIPILNSVES